jgi:hypothetical protein
VRQADGSRFTREAFASRRIRRHVTRQQLERNIAAETRIVVTKDGRTKVGVNASAVARLSSLE